MQVEVTETTEESLLLIDCKKGDEVKIQNSKVWVSRALLEKVKIINKKECQVKYRSAWSTTSTIQKVNLPLDTEVVRYHHVTTTVEVPDPPPPPKPQPAPINPLVDILSAELFSTHPHIDSEIIESIVGKVDEMIFKDFGLPQSFFTKINLTKEQ